MEQNHIWIPLVVLTAMVSMVFEPAQILIVILEVVHGRSDQVRDISRNTDIQFYWLKLVPNDFFLVVTS